MNAKDAAAAKKLVRKGGKVLSIPGMGVDLERFRPASPGEKESLRAELGLPGGTLLLYAAEFSKRKNHKPLIRAMLDVVSRSPDVYLLLAGDGKRVTSARRAARGHPNIIFLGYVQDTAPLVRSCDGAVSSSLSEGLPFNVMEAMASGLPVTAGRVKGHTDLLPDANLFKPNNCADIVKSIGALIDGLQKPFSPENKMELTGKTHAADTYIRQLHKLL
jgi:glycosyltransferase EpsD